MLQEIRDFIKSELQSMLKNSQQSQQKNPGALPLDPAVGWRPQPSSLRAAPVTKLLE